MLIPEYLRLGAWDIIRSWSNENDNDLNSRLALQLVNESALCVSGIRQQRSLSQKGFEVANGLPFVATDTAIHNLLDSHTIKEAQRLQIELGKIRQTYGHYKGKIIIVDPHRITTYSKRQMVRKKKDSKTPPKKLSQLFFCIDGDTKQPICFINGTSAKLLTPATQELLNLTSEILSLKKNSLASKPIVIADNEHYTANLFNWVYDNSIFDLLVPMKKTPKSIINLFKQHEIFKKQWVGYATAKVKYKMKNSKLNSHYAFIQRKGERIDDYDYKAFLCTGDRNEVEDLSITFPERWNIEEFFKLNQALGWQKARTTNLNIQYGKMSMALLAQSGIHMLRKRLGEPFSKWDAEHFAKDIFYGLEGDIKVEKETIVVTFYNAPNSDLLKKHYSNLPDILTNEGINPEIPWLYDFKLDFRFK